MIQRLTSRTRHLLRAFRRDTAGVMAIMVVLLVPVLIGMMGLTIDVGVWYANKRDMQAAVDAAALAAGNEMANGGSDSAATTAAEADADRNGFADATDAITVNMPPLTGPNTGDDSAVEVLITRTLPLFFTTLFLDQGYTAEVRAVVVTKFTEGNFCILSLDPSVAKAVTVEGTGTVELECGVAVKSDADNALNVQGTASLTATSITVGGDIALLGGGILDSDSIARRGSVVDDPYGDIEIPTFSGCDVGSTGPGGVTSVDSTVTFNAADGAAPGILVMCGGFKAVSGADVTFEPGVYILDQGDFEIAGGSSIQGDGVTFILTSSGGDNQIGKVTITGGSDIVLSAPTSDPACCDGYSGIIFYQDRNVSSNSSKSNLIAGGSELELTGAVYMPEQDLRFSGGSKLGDGCTQLIAKQMTIGGDTGIQAACDGSGTRSIGKLKAGLVE